MAMKNLALSANVIVSSNYSDSAGTASPVALTNGNITTGGYQGYWSPSNSTSSTAYATLDLGSVQNIDIIKLYILTHNNLGKITSISISDDNATFNKIITGHPLVDGWNEIELNSVTARYIKFHEFNVASYGYQIIRIYEIEVYRKRTSGIVLKNPTTNQHYSLAEKTLVLTPDTSRKNMVSHGIEDGEEISLNEAFDKIKYIYELSTATQGASGNIVTKKMISTINGIVKISEVKE